MKSRASLMAMLAIAAGTLLGAASGCELIASVDRNKIETGGAGGTTTATGGTTGGGGSTGATGGGGTTGGTGGMTATCDPAKCPAPSSECKEAFCNDMDACDERNLTDGTDAPTQTTGDCKKNVCMGGAVTSVNDDNDPLDDGNACTTDSCDAGSPKSDPTGVDTPCNDSGKTHCDGNGLCVECLDSGDCAAPNPTCKNNACIPATCNNMVQDGDETDVDCGGACGPTCDTDQACGVAGDCISGVCDGTKCLAPACDDLVKNGDESDKDCGGSCPTKCAATKGCNGDADCKGNQCTAAMNGVCVANCQDTEKNNAETDVDCGGGTCGGCAVGLDCGNSDTNCVNTAYCDSVTSKCAAKKNIADPCMGDNQCTSTHCVDSVCCNVACSGVCAACNVAGSVGTCSNIPVGTDPSSECTGNGGSDVCDGSGACAKGQGTTCGGDGECATGHCVDGVCCESTCTGACKACSNAKTGQANGTCANIPVNTDPDSECVGTLSCTGAGACSNPLADGAACTVNGECANGHCVDGVCCNSTCTGLCQACSATKKGQGTDGTCGPIKTHTDPDSECAGALECNGSGACNNTLGANCAGNDECQSGFCADGVCCNNDCTGACRACNTAGSVGTCTATLAGLDPANECTVAGQGADNCNGANACGLGATGVACSPGAVGACAGPVDCPAGGTCP